MEKSKGPKMQSVNQFIKRKCAQDHLSQSKLVTTKNSSVYATDFKPKKASGLRIKDLNADLGRQRNTHDDSFKGDHVSPLATVYRRSFEGCESPKPQMFKEKPSSFLKGESYGQLASMYSSVCSNVQQRLKASQSTYIYRTEKGRPHPDNLTVSKYSHMKAKSIYSESYENITRLPSLYGKKKQEGRKSRVLKVYKNNQV